MACRVEKYLLFNMLLKTWPIPALSYDAIRVFHKASVGGKRCIRGYACMGTDNYWKPTNQPHNQITGIISGGGNVEISVEEAGPGSFLPLNKILCSLNYFSKIILIFFFKENQMK